MVKIGSLSIEGEGKWPRSRAIMKTQLKDFAKSLGLELSFATHKKSTVSWCKVSAARALICEGTGRKLWPMHEVMFHALHEIAHWIQYNEGMFPKYFGKPYYNTWDYPEIADVKRLNLRAERHADWLARKMAMELFAVYLVGGSLYDDTEAAKNFFQEYYGK